MNYYYRTREWCYKNIKPRIVIERMLRDDRGKIPRDYKLFCFGGGVRFIQVDFDRFEHHTRNLYDKDWKRLPVSYLYPSYETDLSAPGNLEQMIAVAQRLAAGFDFVRVDLYSIDGHVFFREMTHYPESGFGRFEPPEYDLEFGSFWPVT